MIELKHIVMTGFILLLTVILFEFINIDVWLQNYFYNFGLHQWIVDRNNAVAKFIFYDGIKIVFFVFFIIIFIGLLCSKYSTFLSSYKLGFYIVCFSLVLVPLSTGALKNMTNTPCPRDLEFYGGNYPYVTVLEHYPANFQQEHKIECFPAGHASGGFALLSLFFLFKHTRNKKIALMVGLSTGWIIGGYKMLIGDHFLSHTIVSMILAWLIVMIISIIMHKRVALSVRNSANIDCA